MKDYRHRQLRMEYFEALYKMTLEYKVSPGLVYIYLPELAKRLGWDAEQQLWAAFINGLTQNPITTLRIMERIPDCPATSTTMTLFEEWFNAEWASLQFDTDRQKNKRGTIAAIQSYAALVWRAGGGRQVRLYQYPASTYEEAWVLANKIHSFGRLSTFSYLEYVNLLGFGPDCDDLMFGDLDGSRSHRNGALFLLGQDYLVLDKRLPNGMKGYRDLPFLATQLEAAMKVVLDRAKQRWPELKPSNFTLESALCAFKNGFFGRRYPGVYADMGWERILWHEERGLGEYTKIFREIREDCLPDWLRIETMPPKAVTPVAQRKAMFAETGFPYRGSFFLSDN